MITRPPVLYNQSLSAAFTPPPLKPPHLVLKETGGKESITEQRCFLRSSVNRVEVNDAEVKMYYTIPVPPESATEETVGVVSIIHHGLKRRGIEVEDSSRGEVDKQSQLTNIFR